MRAYLVPTSVAFPQILKNDTHKLLFSHTYVDAILVRKLYHSASVQFVNKRAVRNDAKFSRGKKWFVMCFGVGKK